MISIDVFGQTYTFKADAGKTDPRMVAEYLTEAVRKIDPDQNSRPAGGSQFILLLQAALNITSEHVLLRQQLAEMSHRIAEQTERLHGLMDNNGQSGNGRKPSPL